MMVFFRSRVGIIFFLMDPGLDSGDFGILG
jgi:hypothetical protein